MTEQDLIFLKKLSQLCNDYEIVIDVEDNKLAIKSEDKTIFFGSFKELLEQYISIGL